MPNLDKTYLFRMTHIENILIFYKMALLIPNPLKQTLRSKLCEIACKAAQKENLFLTKFQRLPNTLFTGNKKKSD